MIYNYKHNKQFYKTATYSVISYINFSINKIIPLVLLLFILHFSLSFDKLNHIINNFSTGHSGTDNFGEIKIKLIFALFEEDILNNIQQIIIEHKILIIICVFMYCVYRHFSNYIGKKYKNLRANFTNSIQQDMLLYFHTQYTHMKLDITTKPKRKIFINEFLNRKLQTKSLLHLFNVIPKLFTCILFIVLLKIYIVSMVFILLLLLIVYIFPKSLNYICTKHIDNHEILSITGKYNQYIQAPEQKSHFTNIFIAENMYIIWNLLSYLGMSFYVLNKSQIDNYMFVLVIVFLLLHPIPTLQEIYSCSEGIELVHYINKIKNINKQMFQGAIDNLSFNFNGNVVNIPNGLTVISGKSGSGKTKLLGSILSINGSNYVNGLKNKTPISNHVTLITKQFFCPLRLTDVFSLYTNFFSYTESLKLISICNLTTKLLLNYNNFSNFVKDDQYHWHLCASLVNKKTILVCDDIDLENWLPILQKYFKKVIVTCDKNNNEYYKKNAKLYIEL